MKTRANSAPDGCADKEVQTAESKLNSKKAVISYTLLLAVVMIALILLSYFIDKRNDSMLDTLNQQNTNSMQRIETLQRAAIELENKNDELTSQVAELEAELEEAKEENESNIDRIEDLESDYMELLKEYNKYKETVNKAEGEVTND